MDFDQNDKNEVTCLLQINAVCLPICLYSKKMSCFACSTNGASSEMKIMS
jgi:hypothetical protein